MTSTSVVLQSYLAHIDSRDTAVFLVLGQKRGTLRKLVTQCSIFVLQ